MNKVQFQKVLIELAETLAQSYIIGFCAENYRDAFFEALSSEEIIENPENLLQVLDSRKEKMSEIMPRFSEMVENEKFKQLTNILGKALKLSQSGVVSDKDLIDEMNKLSEQADKII